MLSSVVGARPWRTEAASRARRARSSSARRPHAVPQRPRIATDQCNPKDYGYDDARIAQEFAAVQAFEQAHAAQVLAMARAQQATANQRAALAALSRWVSQYLKIARIALDDQPKLIEKLGLVASKKALVSM